MLKKLGLCFYRVDTWSHVLIVLHHWRPVLCVESRFLPQLGHIYLKSNPLCNAQWLVLSLFFLSSVFVCVFVVNWVFLICAFVLFYEGIWLLHFLLVCVLCRTPFALYMDLNEHKSTVSFSSKCMYCCILYMGSAIVLFCVFPDILLCISTLYKKVVFINCWPGGGTMWQSPIARYID